MLRARLLTAIVGIPILFVVTWVGGLAFALTAAIVAGIAAWEVALLFVRAGIPIRWMLVSACAVLAVLAAWFGPAVGLANFGLVLALVLGAQLGPGLEDSRVLARWAGEMGAVTYSTLPLLILTLMRSWTGPGWSLGPGLGVSEGLIWVSLVLVATFTADTAAYAVGRSVGRHLLTPRISPRKTWEGTLAGFATAAVIGGIWAPAIGLGVATGAIFGAVIGVAGLVGDLAESRLKRAAATKDASELLPGHGGLLDRLDSVGFASVAVYFVGIWLRSVK